MSIGNQIFQQVIDDIDQGIIVIGNDYKFKSVNQKAKDILGVTVDKTFSHPAGVIKPGDIVIICDNRIGYDDGNLTPSDLEFINVHDSNINKNDMFVGVGVYKNSEIEPHYRSLPNNNNSENLSLKTTFLSYKIEISILSVNRKLSIKVNDTNYEMSFMNSAGHMVIIDCITGNIKFFQTKGYTIRNEDLGIILRGKEFLGKGPDVKDIDLIGRDYSTVIGNGDLGNIILKTISGSHTFFLDDQIFYINKIIVLCSIKPIFAEGRVTGIILKMIDTSEMDMLLKLRNKMIEEMEKVYTAFQEHQSGFPTHFMESIIGNSPEVKKLKTLALKAIRTNSNIIITGESGTGKSQLAYEIHNAYRKGAPFVEVNCSAIPYSIFESELFGYVSGAFTGALSKGKVGYFEKANGGTIFLDEIGELPLDMQVKLLQVIQTKKFYKVGSSTPIGIDMRIIAATNKDLKLAVKEGNFRQDLYYRLNVFPISIPPLRERMDDIYLLVNRITRKKCDEYGIPIKQFSGGALNKLANYDWPGNIRELENIIERSIAIADYNIIYPEYIDIPSNEHKHHETLKDAVESAEKEAIIDALKRTNYNKEQAMVKLGISRATMYEKLKKYGIL